MNLEELNRLDQIEVALVDGVEIINICPHPLDFGVFDPSLPYMKHVIVPSGKFFVRADAIERPVAAARGVTYVETTFIPDKYQHEFLLALTIRHPRALLVGSRYAAQAYAGLVVSTCPLPDNPGLKDPHRFNVAGLPYSLSSRFAIIGD